ncbi:MAG TPA: PVC-type heme-binding CxxCH protein [Chthoniobacteraceae bacterium]|nr:PVC-type heme-binding CxxCH protein [Chthoniobacteraceae bacterium]
MKTFPRFLATLLLASAALAADPAGGNRLAYLDDPTPYWPTPQSPKLTTPQWVGEAGVEAVVVLAIDDMRDPAKYETFLRPILERLKRIDGRAPVSIMTNTVPVDDSHFAGWLKEGLSIESHTLTHPCPLLGKANFAEASRTVHESIDLLAKIPGNTPVAFRMPCCDSMNSASPRFYSEILQQPSAEGRYLAIDSSVFTRPPDPRFKKYFPDEMKPPMKRSLGDYAGYLEDYPYPYTIGNVTWELPCIVPSDWESFNIQGPKTQVMLDDWKAALDDVVKKQGVFTAVFHPHGWSGPEQWVEFIDYAQQTYGKKVLFLNFREVLERLEKNALGGHALRNADGTPGGVRMMDLNGDGLMDVVIGGKEAMTRVWRPQRDGWIEYKTPFEPAGATFGMIRTGVAMPAVEGRWPAALTKDVAWRWLEVFGNDGRGLSIDLKRSYKDGRWVQAELLNAGLAAVPEKGRLLRDFDGDGVCELLANDRIFTWSEQEKKWKPADFQLPPGCAVLDKEGRDNGLRFADLNGDGFDDVIQSNGDGYAIYLWAGVVRKGLGWTQGWPHLVAQGPASTDYAKARVLPFVIGGRNNGAWFHGKSIVWQNEALAPLGVVSVARTFQELIAFDVPPPLSPEKSLAALRPAEGFTVELVASEPLIESPVYFDWDAAGRLWVVEMRDYPLGMDGHGKPGGVIKILTSSKNDGHYDKATVFMEDIPYPNSLMPWRNGVLVASAPDIFFAADTDGDGRADERRVIFTGFKEGNQQHRLNGFEWGLDGWVYGANGNSGGTVTSIAKPGGQPVSISGRDFRFRPDTGEFEAESGETQYGRRRDDWGHWFGNNNSSWGWHYTLSEAYLRRNPKLAVKTTKQTLATYPDASRCFPISELPLRFNNPQSAGHLTSGCSLCPYRDELFGPEFATSVFISEPVHNLVHREVLVPVDESFTSHRAESETDREFLASTDPWFRPTTLKTGPDGALYVADIYRFAIEHPEWIAPETQSRLDLRAGADKGRIYRVYRKGVKLRPIMDLNHFSNSELVALISMPNGWLRDTAQRLLCERKAHDVAELLRTLAIEFNNLPPVNGLKRPTATGEVIYPKSRLQMLATLGTLGELDEATVRLALKDPHPAVRMQALRSSEELAATARELVQAVAALIDDPEFAVRYQLALTLGAFRDDRATAALTKLAERDGANPAMRIAIQSSLAPESPLFAKLNQGAPTAPAPKIELPKPSTPDRAKVLANYAVVGTLKGDAQRGHTLFQQQCANCHRLKNEGHEVGPDLGMANDKPLDWLLTAILDPNAAVEERYRSQTLTLKAGGEVTGLLSTETANNVVVRLPGGTDLPILRSDLAGQKPTGKSLMPDGMETVFKPQDIADIIAWLRAR